MQTTIQYLWKRLHRETMRVNNLIERLVLAAASISLRDAEIAYLRECLVDAGREIERLEGIEELNKRCPPFYYSSVMGLTPILCSGPPRP